jgi:Outer membrane protein beta-barrel domain
MDNNTKYDFEQFLRDSIEDFKMIPTRKIWYGIYNQMHPDRKWPSIAVCIVILTCIMFAGVSHNNEINNATKKYAAQLAIENNKKNIVAANTAIKTAANTNEATIPTKTVVTSNDALNVTNNKLLIANNSLTTNTQLAQSQIDVQNNFVATNVPLTKQSFNPTGNTAANRTTEINNNVNQVAISFTADNTTYVTTQVVSNEIKGNSTISNHIEKNKIAAKENNLTKNIDEAIVINEPLSNTLEPVNKKSTTTIEAITSTKQNILDHKTITKEDIAQRNNYTPTSKTLQGKLRERGSLNYYFTPSIGYRTINKIRENNASANNAAENDLKDMAALNFEIGALLQYKKSKRLTLKAGVQANYTNYISKVVDLGHTTQASIAANSFVSSQNNLRASSYSTKEGDDRLNKTTWQVSLPIGADYAIVGNNNIKWHIGGSIQPTYLLGGSAFVLSTDAKNYITEKSLLRRFNINTAIETFVSIKTAKGIILQLGPQLRYQLLSTYKNDYNYTEKLYNLGFKLAVTTNF